MSDKEDFSHHEEEANGFDDAQPNALDHNGEKHSTKDKKNKLSRSKSRSSSRDRSTHKKRRRRYRSSSRSSRSSDRSRSRRRSSHHRRRSSSRSRSRSRDYNTRGSGYGRNRRTDPENPPPSRCLGVFGLSLYTDEKTLRRYFADYGRLTDVQIIYDRKTNRSRGFGFIYFDTVEEATRARESAMDKEIDGHRIRVDFSFTKRPHTPTPGIYMGNPTYGYSNSSPRGYRDRSRSYSPRR